MANAWSFDRCDLKRDYACSDAEKERYYQGKADSNLVDLAASCILLVFSAMAFRRFLSLPGSSSLCRWTPHQTFHLSHIVFCVLRIISGAFFIADIDATNESQYLLYHTIGDVFQDLMTVAGTFMWLSLMCFWYQVTMPPTGHLKAFQVTAVAVFVAFTVALVVNSVRSGMAGSEGDLGMLSCTAMNSNFIMCINSGAMYLFTSFVTERVSMRLKRMEEEWQVIFGVALAKHKAKSVIEFANREFAKWAADNADLL